MDRTARGTTVTIYEIEVQGCLDESWHDWFDGMTITPLEGKGTRLVGKVPDQACLHGLLAKLRDLALPIISIKRREG